jgi:hypothetical protein
MQNHGIFERRLVEKNRRNKWFHSEQWRFSRAKSDAIPTGSSDNRGRFRNSGSEMQTAQGSRLKKTNQTATPHVP